MSISPPSSPRPGDPSTGVDESFLCMNRSVVVPPRVDGEGPDPQDLQKSYHPGTTGGDSSEVPVRRKLSFDESSPPATSGPGSEAPLSSRRAQETPPSNTSSLSRSRPYSLRLAAQYLQCPICEKGLQGEKDPKGSPIVIDPNSCSHPLRPHTIHKVCLLNYVIAEVQTAFKAGTVPPSYIRCPIEICERDLLNSPTIHTFNARVWYRNLYISDVWQKWHNRWNCNPQTFLSTILGVEETSEKVSHWSLRPAWQRRKPEEKPNQDTDKVSAFPVFSRWSWGTTFLFTVKSIYHIALAIFWGLASLITAFIRSHSSVVERCKNSFADHLVPLYLKWHGYIKV